MSMDLVDKIGEEKDCQIQNFGEVAHHNNQGILSSDKIHVLDNVTGTTTLANQSTQMVDEIINITEISHGKPLSPELKVATAQIVPVSKSVTAGGLQTNTSYKDEKKNCSYSDLNRMATVCAEDMMEKNYEEKDDELNDELGNNITHEINYEKCYEQGSSRIQESNSEQCHKYDGSSHTKESIDDHCHRQSIHSAENMGNLDRNLIIKGNTLKPNVSKSIPMKTPISSCGSSPKRCIDRCHEEMSNITVVVGEESENISPQDNSLGSDVRKISSVIASDNRNDSISVPAICDQIIETDLMEITSAESVSIDSKVCTETQELDKVNTEKLDVCNPPSAKNDNETILAGVEDSDAVTISCLQTMEDNKIENDQFTLNNYDSAVLSSSKSLNITKTGIEDQDSPLTIKYLDSTSPSIIIDSSESESCISLEPTVSCSTKKSSVEETFQPIILDVRGGLCDFDLEIDKNDAGTESAVKSDAGSAQDEASEKDISDVAETMEAIPKSAFELLRGMLQQANSTSAAVNPQDSVITLKTPGTNRGNLSTEIKKSYSLLPSAKTITAKTGSKTSNGTSIILPKTAKSNTKLVFSTQMTASPVASTQPTSVHLPSTVSGTAIQSVSSISGADASSKVNISAQSVTSLPTSTSQVVITPKILPNILTSSTPSSNQFMKYSCVFVQSTINNQPNKLALLIPQPHLSTPNNLAVNTVSKDSSKSQSVDVNCTSDNREMVQSRASFSVAESSVIAANNDGMPPVPVSVSERISEMVQRTLDSFCVQGKHLKKWKHFDLLKPDIQEIHCSEHPSQCSVCGEDFYDMQGLMFHLARPVFHLKYSCIYCKQCKVFSNKCALWKHLRSECKNASLDFNAIHALKPYDFTAGNCSESEQPEAITGTSPVFAATVIDIQNSVSACEYEARHSRSDGLVADKRLSGKCSVCNMVVSDWMDHLTSIGEKILCKDCNMTLPNSCAWTVHSQIHFLDPKKPEGPKIICPECGECNFITSGTEEFRTLFDHLDSCKHFNRIYAFNCVCVQECVSVKHLINHFATTHLKNLFKCQFCVLAFTQQDHFVAHCQKIHKVQNAVVKATVLCAVCQQVLNCADDAKKHVDFHVENVISKAAFKWKCFICSKKFTQKSDLHHHAEADHPHKPKRCTICFRLFSNRKNLVDHLVYKQCSRIFPKNFSRCVDIEPFDEEEREINFTELFNKSSSVLTPSSSTALEMPRLASSSSHIRPSLIQLLHRVSSHEQGPVREKNALPRQDSKTVGPAIKYQCHSCRIIITGKANYYEHLRVKHQIKNVDGDFIRCVVCKKLVKSASLNNHLKVHQCQGIIICAWCQRRDFKSLAELSDHEKALCGYRIVEGPAIVLEEEPEKDQGLNAVQSRTCQNSQPNRNACAEQSVEHSDLEGTLNSMVVENENDSSQTALRVFPCLLCGLAFQSLLARDEHVSRQHDGIRTVYHCMMCKKKGQSRSFSNKKLASRHICKKHRIVKMAMVEKLIRTEEQNVSNGQKLLISEKEICEVEGVTPLKRLRIAALGDFLCGKCGFSCSESDEFSQHISSHNSNNEPQCPECGLCFTVLPALKKHLYAVHKIKTVDAYLKEKNIKELEIDEDEPDLMPEIHPLPQSPSLLEPINKLSTMAKASTSNPLECTVCYKVFDSEAMLKTHMRNHGVAFIRSRRHKP